jgi:hypothetical protein
MESQIEQAKKHIRALKSNMPYLFVQYANMKNAEKEYKEALLKYETAKTIWENLAK